MTTWILIAASVLVSGRCVADEPIRVLFLGDSGHHQPKARFAELEPVLKGRGVDMTYTEDMSMLEKSQLGKFEALVLYANIDSIAPEQASALLSYVNEGGGFVPLHCATFCFRNNPEIVALMGAQFQRHGTGVFRTTIAEPEHPVMRDFGGFESWDETYVHHLHNEKDRTILEYRVDAEGREPWTWIRTHGKGRVFYTAWGHDGRTWNNPGFQNLVERGIRYVTHREVSEAGPYLDDQAFPVPEMTSLPQGEDPFKYVDVGAKIPNYTKSNQWGTQGKPLNMMQLPLEPAESMKRYVTPKGFRLELFVSEPELEGKPIAMAWDERGRLWVCETYDYPNELQPPGKGRDRIRICEDTDRDGKADKFTVFAENLSIPTGIAFHRGGALIQDGTQTLYLKDTDGDDVADVREVLITGWALGDTHGGVSNFQYGLDNWIWGMQGYNNSEPVALGKKQQRFRMGFFRMRPDGSEVEFIRSTNNNTWGLGISEEGLIFGSTANGNPSIFMPIANRYYEQVRGWTPSLTLSSIADSNDFDPITDKVRQVDHHGGYTAAAGHSLYTARQYPKEYWNRVAFVNGPTGHLVGSFVLQQDGAGFKSTSPFNLVASDDEWAAPIMAEVGPDGNVWVIDWYNYIVQHNPTPQGFKTGQGNAYETDLRDKKHGRIYRVVYEKTGSADYPDLSKATPQQWVDALKHSSMVVRKHAQRLLVERGDSDVVDELIQLVADRSTDGAGLNVGAIHALWTLHGLGQLTGTNAKATAAAYSALAHPSAGVRRNAVQVLPPATEAAQALIDGKLHLDKNPNTQIAALLALATLPASNEAGAALVEVLGKSSSASDRWVTDAVTSAAAHNAVGFLTAMANVESASNAMLGVTELVAGHYARGDSHEEMSTLVSQLKNAPSNVLDAVIRGLAPAWNEKAKVALTAQAEADLEEVLKGVDAGTRGVIVQLASKWGIKRFETYAKEVENALLDEASDESKSDEDRGRASKQLVEFRPTSDAVVSSLLDLLTARTSPELTRSILAALEASRAESLGEELVDRLAMMTPSAKSAALTLILKRPASTTAFLEGAKSGKASLADLALDQKQALAAHPDKSIRESAQKLLESGGVLPNADRQKVLDELMFVTHKKGDPVKGKAVYTTHCSKCHVHSGEGYNVGPDLTGMAVHPKEELLVHILDPSRSVEGNFRTYTILTADGLVLSGMLASESKTALELFDTEGKKKAVLREDIEELVASNKSVMPEGFEKAIKPEEMVDLLEFLTQRGKFVPLDLSKVATVASDRGMFVEKSGTVERLIFDDWSPKTFAGVPFALIDPSGGKVSNVIELYSPNGNVARSMPKSVKMICSGPAKAIHVLGGVAGWAHPYGSDKSVSLVVRLHYADGQTEDHELLNGVHIVDYIRRVDVPESQFAFDLSGRQVRYLSVIPKRAAPLAHIELMKGNDNTAPVVMAMTLESP